MLPFVRQAIILGLGVQHMVFSSLIFLYGFFSLSLLGYSLCRTQRAQNTVLLVFSLIFYA